MSLKIRTFVAIFQFFLWKTEHNFHKKRLVFIFHKKFETSL